ncbi:MAG: hypothetical protein K0R98_2061 [Rickettsiaceae bacterium]|jgi:hypothetical protein|nr:hypothetical protein [Rickettsiaceae bacterium]
MKITLLILALIAISACTVRPDLPKVKIPGVTIEGSGGNGGFCPPGQAKKGNC